MITGQGLDLLGLLQSRVTWFILSQISTPLRLRAGLWQYRILPQNIKRLPIPELTSTQEQQLANYAEQITALAQERYQLHEAFRHRVQSDIGAGGKLNTKLTEWYDLPDFSAFREEIKKSFGASHDIAVRERGDWEAYLRDEQAKHNDLTQQIIALETQLNAVVYQAFNLTPDEIALIEEATKYPYGAV